MPEPRTPIDEAQAGIIDEMSGLEDVLARYEYLVAQGDALPVADGELRSERYAIPGCQASVWLRAELREGRLRLHGDSDARINRGIVALLLRVLDDRTPAEILAADLYFLERTGLSTHLSPVRANGLAALVQRIRACAQEHALTVP
jgi:cysteine desulfuration protein SufE